MKFASGKCVLVTGGTGFIGSNLIRRLVDLGFDVHTIIRKTSNIWRIKDIAPHIKIHHIDLMNSRKLNNTLQTIQPEGIFHLASLGVYGGVESTVKNYVLQNILATTNLIQASDSLNYNFFVNSGSSSEYGNKLRPMSENMPCYPDTIYGITKLSSTLFAKAYAKKTNKPILTLRIFSPFGPYDNPQRLISSIIIKLLKKEPITIGNPHTVRDYIYISDVIDYYIAAATYAKTMPGQIINIGTGKQTTTKEIVEMINKIGNFNAIINYSDSNSRSHESTIWQANTALATIKLHLSPKYSLESGVRETTTWFKQNIHLY